MEGSCSVRMVQPFAAFAAGREDLRDLAPPALFAMDLDARLPLRLTQAALLTAAERLNIPTLGLRMGQGLSFGTGGVYDYVVRSAPTVSASLAVASRYSRLIASPFAVTLESHGRKSVLRFDDDVPWSAVSADFAVSGWYRAHAADELPRGAHPECWFPYAAPRDTAEHERTFPNAVLKFGAPFLGIVFEQSHVTAPMTVGDPVVHTMLCARADSLLSELRHSESLTRIVRSLIAESLRDGDVPSVEQVARRLHMSHRTVSRRLEREGTNFATELDDKRRELALTLVQQASLPLSGVAFRVGFSHTESFFRAFKRWTGTTPQTYRARPPAPPVI